MIHVIPINDLREHQCDTQCWCQPVIDDDVCVHNALDQRETYEQGRKPQ